MKNWLAPLWDRTMLYIRHFTRWVALAALTGTLCGTAGAAFHHAVHWAGEWRDAFPPLLYALPLAGLLIAWLYHATHTEGLGTNDILGGIQTGKGVVLWLLPVIFLSTFLTHLTGGSSGREGAALQMGGVLGYHTGRSLNLDDKDCRTATTAGMAAFFTALFGTPVAATLFSVTVVSVGRLYYADMLPCLTASLTAYGVSRVLCVEPTRFTVLIPEVSPNMLLQVLILSILCALVSVLFCETIHILEHVFHDRLPNPWKRAAAGGLLLIGMTLLSGTRAYNGAGMESIVAAVEEGTARPEAFLMKLLFTAVTLAAEFKGGEVVPSFFVGATFGAAAGPLLGIPAGFAGSVGLIGVFCGATNCTLASIFLAMELYGGGGLWYYAVACSVCFSLSGYSGLYSSQLIVYSKFKDRFINVRANAHRLGEKDELKEERE